MPNFEYTALDKKGKDAKGTIEAENRNKAIDELKEKGFHLTSVTELKKHIYSINKLKWKKTARKKEWVAKTGFGSITIFQPRKSLLYFLVFCVGENRNFLNTDSISEDYRTLEIVQEIAQEIWKKMLTKELTLIKD